MRLVNIHGFCPTLSLRLNHGILALPITPEEDEFTLKSARVR
jgi:hypothetical protein